jgi:LysM repeat protein
MEFEERNPKPEEKTSGLPTVVLFILIGIICLLLYAGWHMMSDDASKVGDLKEATSEGIDGKEYLEADSSQNMEYAQQTEVPVETEVATATPTPEPEIKVETPKPAETKAAEPIKLSGESVVHTVKEGETFFGIGNKFNVTAATLKKLNPGVDPNGIKVGVTKITIPIQGYHTVGPGDILRVVGEKYNVSVDLLMSANGKTKNMASRGEKLVIPNSVKK